ncbi:MAG: hypothetical protein KF705_08935 [Phycisphaeraceae bacterium]|nr:hypothetical protein [Phycisphaeraceae bacterium]
MGRPTAMASIARVDGVVRTAAASMTNAERAGVVLDAEVDLQSTGQTPNGAEVSAVQFLLEEEHRVQ